MSSPISSRPDVASHRRSLGQGVSSSSVTVPRAAIAGAAGRGSPYGSRSIHVLTARQALGVLSSVIAICSPTAVESHVTPTARGVLASSAGHSGMVATGGPVRPNGRTSGCPWAGGRVRTRGLDASSSSLCSPVVTI